MPGLAAWPRVLFRRSATQDDAEDPPLAGERLGLCLSAQ